MLQWIAKRKKLYGDEYSKSFMIRSGVHFVVHGLNNKLECFDIAEHDAIYEELGNIVQCRKLNTVL